MKPQRFLWITFLFSINIISAPVRANNPVGTNCTKPFSCGGISDVKFPFWGGGRAHYCGRPELELNCQENIPRFTINSVTYRILRYTSSTQSLTVARDDYSNTTCPSEYKNTTFDPTVFRYDDGIVVNMTLLYGCSIALPGLPSQSCDSGGGTNVYYVTKLQYVEVCSYLVIIPIFKTSAGAVMLNQMTLRQALDDGFSMQWIVDSDDCKACIESNGECGYGSGGEFTCFTGIGTNGTDGTHTVPYITPNGTNSDNGTVPYITPNGTNSDNGTDGTHITPNGTHIIPNSDNGTDGTHTTPFSDNNRTDGAHISSYSDGNIIEKAFLIPLISLVAIFILIGNIIRRKAKATENDQHIVEFIRNHEALTTKKYSYSDVKKMTNKFAHKLGQGGYGSVYSGRLLDGRPVAVKLLSESKDNGEEFINEVASISRTSHINVVSLLGFCYEGSKRALIYEFMSNGSLDKFIYNQRNSNMNHNLEWKTLYEIAVGIARGLEYLHRGCNMRILHFDIKPHNILLDDRFCPKISDFGLAKVCSRDKSAISILGARGTIGYIAPEVFSRNFGRVSYKSDVYSYGMMVLEMVGARNGTDLGVSHTSSEVDFPNHIYKSLEAGHALKVDGVTNEEEEKIFKKMVLVSLWSIQTNPSDRPSMTRVLEMLEGSLQSLPFPPLPFLSCPPRSPPRSDGSYSTTS